MASLNHFHFRSRIIYWKIPRSSKNGKDKRARKKKKKRKRTLQRNCGKAIKFGQKRDGNDSSSFETIHILEGGGRRGVGRAGAKEAVSFSEFLSSYNLQEMYS